MESTRAIILSIYFLCEAIALILGVSGNLIVIYVMICKKKLARSSNKFIVSVAFADLSVGLIAIPIGVTTVSLNFNISQQDLRKDKIYISESYTVGSTGRSKRLLSLPVLNHFRLNGVLCISDDLAHHFHRSILGNLLSNLIPKP